jgi:hypothetical protein
MKDKPFYGKLGRSIECECKDVELLKERRDQLR